MKEMQKYMWKGGKKMIKSIDTNKQTKKHNRGFKLLFINTRSQLCCSRLCPHLMPSTESCKNLRRQANNLEIVVTKRLLPRDFDATITTPNHSASIPHFNLHLARNQILQSSKLELVESRRERDDVAQSRIADLDLSFETLLVLCDEENTRYRVFTASRDGVCLCDFVGVARSANGQSVVPEGALDGFTVGRVHVGSRSVAPLPRIDEGRKNLPVTSMVVAIRQSLCSVV